LIGVQESSYPEKSLEKRRMNVLAFEIQRVLHWWRILYD